MKTKIFFTLVFLSSALISQSMQAQISSATLSVGGTSPSVTSISSDQPSYCHGDPADIEIASGNPAGGIWTWYDDDPCLNPGANVLGTGTILSLTSVSNNSLGPITETYYVQSVNPSCPPTSCTSWSKSITINPAPSGSITMNNTSVCSGADGEIIFNTTQSGSFTLDIQEGPNLNTYGNISDGDMITIGNPSDGSHTYELMSITDANGCIAQ